MTGLRCTRRPLPWVGINISHHHLSIDGLTFPTAALSRAGAEVEMFAPEVDQAHVVDHSKGAEMDQTRR